MESQKDNQQDLGTYSEKYFPIANIGRIMKKCLPDQQNVKLSKDSKVMIQQCVSDFVTFVTSEASEKCMNEKRKTINGEDILHSLHLLGFGQFNENLKIFHHKYRQAQQGTNHQNISNKDIDQDNSQEQEDEDEEDEDDQE